MPEQKSSLAPFPLSLRRLSPSFPLIPAGKPIQARDPATRRQAPKLSSQPSAFGVALLDFTDVADLNAWLAKL